MSDKHSLTVELSEGQLAYLDSMVEKFALPDRSKAIRCLVNFPRDTPAEEERIFGEVRCLDC
ncbi:MAG: hypothetical protein VX527_01090 [Planctomycetota bacterium]|nr:hypothetical protein [Planctomycetota bacterium]